MNIPERAVEAAMEAGADFGYIGHRDADTIEGDGTFDVRAALEAAAPYLYAQALRDAAEQFRTIANEAPSPIGRVVRLNDAKALWGRADELDPHE